MTSNTMNRYRIADISISEDCKTLWVGYVCKLPGGEAGFSWVSVDIENIDDAVEFLKHSLNRELAEIKQLVKHRSRNEDRSE